MNTAKNHSENQPRSNGVRTEIRISPMMLRYSASDVLLRPLQTVCSTLTVCRSSDGRLSWRRRVGKTYLLSHFAKGKRAVYFTATRQDTDDRQLRRFAERLGEQLGDEVRDLAPETFPTWKPRWAL